MSKDKAISAEKLNAITATTNLEPHPSLFGLYGNDSKNILEIMRNGDIFVKGKLVENNQEVVDAFRDFLVNQGYLYE